MTDLYTTLLDAEKRSALSPFWAAVNAQLDQIESTKASTAREILDALGSPRHANAGFFAGSGGDRTLLGSLLAIGWRLSEYNADYYWTAVHPETCEVIEYIEGDVYDRTNG